MTEIIVIKPCKAPSPTLINMIRAATLNKPYRIIEDLSCYLNLKNKKLLFALEINHSLWDVSMVCFMENLALQGNNPLEGSIGAFLCHSSSELGTKNFSQDMLFLASSLGCNFIGHCLVEATNSLRNLLTWQKVLKIPLEDILYKKSSDLGNRLATFQPFCYENPKISVLYSSPHKVSNTLELWYIIKGCLSPQLNIKEILVENGAVLDCKGCPYDLCMHYGKRNGCFYGGVMVENILPAIEEADIIIWLCPNYNDAIAANLTAVINRLTVLYNKISFYNKSMFGIIVSGNSGGDSVSKQLIGALNINKGFFLPSHGILTATANDPLSIHKYDDIYNLAKDFSDSILKLC